MLSKISRRILFLDESGFNLHTSTNYGYSGVNEDAFMFQPASKGQNISLCAIIANNGVQHFKLIDGSYNRKNFVSFLNECHQRGVFENNPILVMDNVRFHHCHEIGNYLDSINVESIYLPPYSPDLNPIENVFSCTKERLNVIRPRATRRDELKRNITEVVENLGELREYYRSFWERVNAINNRMVE